MADNFTAEATNTGGEIFATDQNAGDSAHYPVGKLAWGPLNTFNLTDTASPFPVQLIEGSSGGPIFSHGDSAGTPSGIALVYESDTAANTFSVVGQGSPLPVQMVTDPVNVQVTDIDTAAFAGIIQNIAYSSAANGYDAPNSALRISIVSGADANDTTVTVSNDSTQPVVVKHATPADTNEYVFVKSAGGNYPVTQTTDPWTVVGNNDTASRVVIQGALPGGNVPTKEQYSAVSTAGSIVAQAFSLTSAAQSVMTTEGRLHGYSLSNPDTATNVWVNVFEDDTAGVTIGTTTPAISVMVPFGGGREMSQNPLGVYMSSGMTIVASGGAGTDTSSPSTTIEATFYFAPSS